MNQTSWKFSLTLATTGLLLGLMSFSQPVTASLINDWEPLDLDGTPTKTPLVIKPGDTWQDPISQINMLWITGGCFQMGSPPRTTGRETDEGPIHQSCVDNFWLGETEVTQGQWRRIILNNPAKFRQSDAHPVENVSWEDVDDFISYLNNHSQLNITFRLPTEAEWEFACRNGGERTEFPGSTQPSQIAWYAMNSNGITQATGTRKPNRLGLKDMSGNVWEWLQDHYRATYANQANTNNQENKFFSIRGGGWKDEPKTLRCANRGFESITTRRPDLGLRLAASLKGKEKKAKTIKIDRKHMPF